MFKNKFFLNGIGVGLICGAVMLQLVHTVEQMEDSAALPRLTAADELSVDQLKDLAAGKGYQLVSKNEPLYSSQQLEEAKSKAVSEATQKWESQRMEAPASDPSTKKRGVYIKQGLDSSAVAAKLLEFGIIQDQAKFVEAISQQQLNKKVYFGYYEFDANPSLQDVIKTITTPQ